MQKAGPTASDPQIVVLENDYIFPSVQLVFDLLEDLKLPSEMTKAHFESLLSLITEKRNITPLSTQLSYGEEDIDLKKGMENILSKIDKEIFDEIYNSLYILLHQYYLNKNPDNAADIRHNAEIADQTVTRHVSRDELFEGTVILFDCITKRLSKLGPDLSIDELQQLVVKSIINAKALVLNPPPKVNSSAIVVALKPPRTFIPQFGGPEYQRQVKVRQEEELSEMLAKQMQEEEDRLLALRLQNGSNEEEEEYFEEDEAGAGPGLDQDVDEQVDQDDDDEEEEEQDDDNDDRYSGVARTRPRPGF